MSHDERDGWGELALLILGLVLACGGFYLVGHDPPRYHLTYGHPKLVVGVSEER